jgi:hypothetical protein
VLERFSLAALGRQFKLGRHAKLAHGRCRPPQRAHQMPAPVSPSIPAAGGTVNCTFA